MPRRRYHQQLFVTGIQRHQFRPFDAIVAKPQGHFAPPNQIGDLAARRRAKPQANMRRAGRERAQSIEDIRIRERADQRERDCTFDARLEPMHCSASIPERGQCCFRMRQEDAACLGKMGPAAQTLEQRRTKLMLDNLEAAADRRL